jgi:hypothetical protein
MALDDIVVPAIKDALRPLIGATPGFGDIKFGEWLQVAQPPEMWILPTKGGFPEKEGSELEQSDWVLDLKMLYPFANDAGVAEATLAALIEPVRQVFRRHLKLGRPQQIARARVLAVEMTWTIVNGDVYRAYTLKAHIKEKIPTHFSA